VELSWSSFILEIINFLVLIWILKHFFYAPIQNVISTRKKAIQNKIDKAKKLDDEARQLKIKYENRLKDWESEKALKQKDIQQEMDEWKSSELANFEKTLEKEREKVYSREMRRVSSALENNAKESMLAAGKFAAQFLKCFADSDLENKIVDKTIDDLSHFSDKRLLSLQNHIQEQLEINIQSSYPLSDTQKQRLTEVINKLLESRTNVVFTQDTHLLAGLSIKVGSVLLQANLRDELKFFIEEEQEHA
jgi:F-type H+-transporting ATPase subunit b